MLTHLEYIQYTATYITCKLFVNSAVCTHFVHVHVTVTMYTGACLNADLRNADQ